MPASLNHQTVPGEWDNNPVYSRIKTLVISQDLPPGKRIRLEPLADRLFVSNTPVREALIQLAAERLIDDVPNAGFFTKKISEAEMRDLYILHRLMLDWSLSVVRPEGEVPGMLKPPEIFDIRADAPLLSPQSTVEMADALFMHIAKQSGNADAICIIRNINERTRYLRLREAELIDDIRENLLLLCSTYHRQDIEKLRLDLLYFHEKRLAMMPDIIRLIRLAKAGASSAHKPEKTGPPG